MRGNNKFDKKNIEDIYALTPMQEGLLFHHLKDPNSNVYFEQLELELFGDIKFEHFRKAWNYVIQNNEVLRSFFRWEKMEKPAQIVLMHHTCQIIYHDLSHLRQLEKHKQLESVKSKDRNTPFNLMNVPFRVILFKVKDKQYNMIISSHHILYDGWSNGIILKEFFDYYYQLSNGNEIQKRIKPKFSEFVKWIQNIDIEKAGDYWRSYLKGFDTFTGISLIKNKVNSSEVHETDTKKFVISCQKKKKMEQWLIKNKITMAAFLYCAWGLLLQWYNNIDDVIFGTTVSGRSAKIKNIENIVGIFINTIPLRVNQAPGIKIVDHLLNINNDLIKREEYEQTSLVKIKEYSEINISEDLFDTLVVIENYPLDKKLMEPNDNQCLKVNSFSMWERTHYNLTISILISEEIHISIIYNKSLFLEKSIVRLGHHYLSLLQNLSLENYIECEIGDIELLTESERNELLISFNETSKDYAYWKSVHQLFGEVAKQHSNRIALIGQWEESFQQKDSHCDHLGMKYPKNEDLEIGNEENLRSQRLQLTYGELDLCSNWLAKQLIAKGIKCDSLVGIMLNRSVDLLIGLLGVLKAGGAYLPLAHDYPDKRIAYVLEKSLPVMLLIDSTSMNRVKQFDFNGEIFHLSTQYKENVEYYGFKGVNQNNFPIKINQHSQDLIYVIFTSGTTGNPKGVMVQHQNVVNFMTGMKKTIDFSLGKRLASFTTISFDIFVLETWVPLSCGMQVVMGQEDEQKDSKHLSDLITDQSIDVLQLTPSRLKLLYNFDPDLFMLKGISELIVGGEAFPAQLLSHLHEVFPGRLYNVYGPTETTVWSAVKELTHTNSVTLGIPIANTQIYIVDRYFRLQPTNVPGELLIDGDGVVRGYLNNPELTAERFCLRRAGGSFCKNRPLHPRKNFLYKQKFLEVLEPFFKKVLTRRRHRNLYRTGDLARWLFEGELEFLGRMDHQVKVRGFRIELEEIREQLLAFEGIKEAVVVDQVDKADETILCAYIVRDDQTSRDMRINAAGIHSHLSIRLPQYMIPSYFINIEKLPLTPNGKLDRRQLPNPEIAITNKYIAPRDQLEEQLVGTWSELFRKSGLDLASRGIGIDDHFFQMGGHSLMAISLISRIHKRLNVEVPLGKLYKFPNIRLLAQYIRKSHRKKFKSIPSVEKREYYKLSSGQKRLYILQQMDEDSTIYNMPVITILPGTVNINQLYIAFRGLIKRHESLRTSFCIMNEEPVQRIHKSVEFMIKEIKSDTAEIYKILREEGDNQSKFPMPGSFITELLKQFTRSFDLSKAPLIRVILVKKENFLFLFIDMHHIITDGYSQQLLEQELINLYNGESLKSLRLQYRDFTQWQNIEITGEKIRNQGRYWKEEFSNEIPLLNLPYDYSRLNNNEFDGDSIDFQLSVDEGKGLKKMAEKYNGSIYFVLLSMFYILLSKLSDQEDIVIGTPVAGREQKDLEDVIGVFVNTLAIRNFPASDKIFENFLLEVIDHGISAFENQYYPFELLVDALNITREAGRNPLFDVMLVWQDIENEYNLGKFPGLYEGFNNMPQKIGNETGTNWVYRNQMSKFDLVLNVINQSGQLHFRINYRTSLFKRETVEEYSSFLRRIITNCLKDIHQPIGNIEMLSLEEKRQLIFEFNRTETNCPFINGLHEIVKLQSNRRPHHISLICYEEHISYSVLNQRADNLGMQLKSLGLQNESFVALLLERSIELIVSILAILKCGGAYIPLDPNYPWERISYILKDSLVQVILTNNDNHQLDWFNGKIISPGYGESDQWIQTPEKVDFQLSAEKNSPGVGREFNESGNNIAYIIYTSGSTGRPRGVIVQHHSIINFISHQSRFFQLKADERILQFSTISFDASMEQIFLALYSGSVLVIIKRDDIIDKVQLLEFLGKYGITHFHGVPSFLKTLNLEETFGLRRVISGGEECPVFLARSFYGKIDFYNKYGPTETTITSVELKLARWEHFHSKVPLGRPISNTRIYVIGRSGQLMHIRVTGELYIGGSGLARGYLNNPALTEERFGYYLWDNYDKTVGTSWNKTHPYFLCKNASIGERIYKTGDLCRWMSDGNMEFIGRLDQQVKVRGYRIELGEIENQLLRIAGITESVVVLKRLAGNDSHIVAYVVSDNNIEEYELKSKLSKKLPLYMVPSFFIFLEKIPLTPNGKIDRKSLPEPQTVLEPITDYPKNLIEERLIKLWSRVLGIDDTAIGIKSNFFNLGGHSLNATILISIIYKEFKVKIPLNEFFRVPTIEGLARYIKTNRISKYHSIEPIEKKEYYCLSPAQKRLYIIQQMDLNSVAYNMPYFIELPIILKHEKLQKLIIDLMKRHESLRTSFTMIGDEPVQRIHDNVELEIKRGDKLKEPPGTHSLMFKILKGFIRPFDLSELPLVRIESLAINDSQFLILDMHHIISDGISLRILHKEFTGLIFGKMFQNLRLQYKDFAYWQGKNEQQDLLKYQERYWLSQFPNEVPVLNFPSDYPRPLIKSFDGNIVNFLLTENETQILKELGRKTDSTLYMSLFVIYSIWLTKLTGQEDIIVGAPIAARRHADLEEIIGMFVNTLAIRCYPSLEKSVLQYLEEVKSLTLSAYENQEYQFEVLVEKLSVRRDTSRNPIFDVMLNLFNQSDRNNGFPVTLKLNKGENKFTREKNEIIDSVRLDSNTLEVKKDDVNHYNHQQCTSKFDLNMTVIEQESQFLINLEYSSLLFKPETIDRYIGYFRQVLQSFATNIDIKISEIDLLRDEEKKEVLEFCSGVYEDGIENMTLHNNFYEQVQENPDWIGLVFDDLKLSYLELENRSNVLAGLLMKQGIGMDCIVGIKLERSAEMIFSILGILKAGGAYLPIDPGLPIDRINYMLLDSGASALITASELNKEIDIPESLNSANYFSLIFIDQLQFSDPLSHSLTFSLSYTTLLAYIIYTSGTTGRPKGVMIDHCNVVNLFKYQYKYSNIDNSRILQFATLSFDASFHEIFSALLCGGVLYLINEEKRSDVEGLFHYIGINEIKTVFFPMSFLRMLFGDQEYISLIPSCIEHIQTAGEQVVVNDGFRSFLRKRGIYLHNHYGPSETHVVTTLTLNPQEEIPELPSIGKPILNTSIYIFGIGGNLLPVGITGELVIGGIQVGRGYLNNPELTYEKFDHDFLDFYDYPDDKKNTCRGEPCVRPNRVQASRVRKQRLYKTGDLSRYQSDGNIEFLGRIDHQVKVRGFRVELGEIESRLSEFIDIKECVVIARKEKKGDQYLCAYLVSANKLEPGKLREYLLKNLPDYMVPSYFVYIDEIPVTISGKVNYKALPSPGNHLGNDYVPPRNDLERQLVKIWKDVLCRDSSNVSQKDTSQNIGIDNDFFELGGQSLKATILISRLHRSFQVKVPLAEIFKAPTIRGLSKYIQKASKTIYTSIKPVEKREYYHLSSSQKRLFILHQIKNSNTVYNMPGVIPLGDGAKISELEFLFTSLISRHESLRTSFHLLDNKPIQYIHDDIEFKIEEILDDDNRNKNVRSEVETYDTNNRINYFFKEFIRPFDLSESPLLRVGLIKGHGIPSIMLIDMHHIISDGLSIDILTKDFLTFQRGGYLCVLRLQYKDFTLWQNRMFHQKFLGNQEDYWKEVFSDELPILDLPLDYPRPTAQSFDGSTINFELLDSEVEQLRQLTKDINGTLFITLLSIFSIFLSKLSGQEDIVIGSPIANRRHEDLEGIIGVFINSLAIRSFPSREKSFKEFLSEMKSVVLSAFENQEYPFEKLVEQLNVSRDTSRNPLFDVMFNLLRPDESTQEILGEINRQDVLTKEHTPGVSKFDMTLIVVELEDSIHFTIEYCSTLFKSSTIERFIGCFCIIIKQLSINPYIKLSDIDILTHYEKEKILKFCYGTRESYNVNQSIQTLFQEQTQRNPNFIAVEFKDQKLSYLELDKMSSNLANVLRKIGVIPDKIISIILNRSLEMIIGIFSVLKAGGCYLPIDPEYPEMRVKYILLDSDVNIILSHRNMSKDIEKIEHFQLKSKYTIIYIDETKYSNSIGNSMALSHSSSSNLAYAIYSSGSTGRPKGVLIKHISLINRLCWMQRKYPLDSKDIILQKTTFSFDVSVWEIFWWSIVGASVYLLEPGGEKDPDLIAKTIEKIDVSILHFVPSMLSVFLDYLKMVRSEFKFSSLRQVFTSGEELTASQVKMFSQLLFNTSNTNLSNLYGPTEATIDVSYFDCTTGETLKKIPIGKPIQNIQLFIINACFQIQPIGLIGELVISGICLSRGYLNKPERTSERFIFPTYHINDSLPIYKTGDLARWLFDGNIEFLGRMDHQVKLRGFRIELGEIEAQLLKISGIKEAVVLLIEKSQAKYLCAYIVVESSGTAVDTGRIKDELSKRLPLYMLPSFYTILDQIPLTANGKINRKSLPSPEVERNFLYIPPRNEIEKQLVNIWSDILGIDKKKMSILANFFEFGGNSLIATVMISRVHQRLNVIVPLFEIFKNPTIRGLAVCIQKTDRIRFEPIHPVEKREYYKMSSSQRYLYVLQQFAIESFAYNMPYCFQLSESIIIEKLEEVFAKLLLRHEGLRTSFHIFNNNPIQRIQSDVKFKIKLVVYPEYSEGNERVLDHLKSFVRPFDLSKAPLIRVELVKVGTTQFLLLDMHHIITDGISQEILIRELNYLYNGERLLPLRLQYKDYAVWKNRDILKESFKKQEVYWKKQFQGEIPVLNLPIDFPRPKLQSFKGKSITFELGKKETAELKQLCFQENTTLYIMLLTIYIVFFSKITSQEDIIIGTDVANRNHNNLHDIVGMFVNTLALRFYLKTNMTFKEFLNVVKEKTLKNFANQEYPFGDLVKSINIKKDNSRNPLFDVMFTFLDIKMEPNKLNSSKKSILNTRPFLYSNQTSKFDLSLTCVEVADGLQLTFEYCKKLFRDEKIQNFTVYFREITNSIIKHPKIPIVEIEIISEGERNRLIKSIKCKGNNLSSIVEVENHSKFKHDEAALDFDF